MRWISCLLAVSMVLTPVSSVWAGPQLSAEDADARRRALDVFKQGRTAYKAGDYDAALRFFRQAQAIYQHEALIILALAKTLDKAGDGERALSYYRLFLKEAPENDPDRGSTVQRIAALEAELAARPGFVVLQNLPSGAEVTVDGKAAAIDHRAGIKLAAGTYKVAVRMKNRLPFERTVEVTAGRETKIDVVLLEPVDPSKLPRDYRWTWITGGLAAASLLTTGVLAVRGSSLRNDYGVLFDEASGRATETGRKRYDCPPTATKDEDCPELVAEGERLRSDIISNDTLTASFGIATGALAIGTLVAWLAAPVKQPAEGSTVTWTPQFGPRSAGMTLSLRF
ncbi:MAG: hypothetical protein RIT45_2903 [Pseudomonadota bacterium]|jgi:hypothetical protein